MFRVAALDPIIDDGAAKYFLLHHVHFYRESVAFQRSPLLTDAGCVGRAASFEGSSASRFASFEAGRGAGRGSFRRALRQRGNSGQGVFFDSYVTDSVRTQRSNRRVVEDGESSK